MYTHQNQWPMHVVFVLWVGDDGGHGSLHQQCERAKREAHQEPDTLIFYTDVLAPKHPGPPVIVTY